MRRAFTLIELLVVVAIIGLMVTVAVVSVQEGQEYAALRGSVRSVFAAIRQARSIALVSQKPAVITFSSSRSEDSVRSKVEITSVSLMESKANIRARSITGEWKILGEEAESVPAGKERNATQHGSAASDSNSGQTVEEILFSPVSEEVLTGVCIKVVMDDEDADGTVAIDNEVRRSRISVFSNVDFLMSSFKKGREAEKERKEKETAAEETALQNDVEEIEAEKSVAWQTNGRCDPHRIYIYPETGTIEDAWVIKVDRFGGVKVLEEGEE